ncbi:hypothetical protein C2845_PM02G11400 [Panicum miliaceum]|uniref:Uncharacterized protein n=1 Tax=Panicum miliaceum TaxID=4540 RepID=A0A3L6S4I1_PANMI|nr:hypothetical protein C2845_PM02G11400 [Panicum miliaceum]
MVDNGGGNTSPSSLPSLKHPKVKVQVNLDQTDATILDELIRLVEHYHPPHAIKDRPVATTLGCRQEVASPIRIYRLRRFLDGLLMVVLCGSS